MPPRPTALAYWKQHDELKLYRPPIVHGDFSSTPLKRFQKKKKLPETGVADATTVDVLYSATGY